MNQVHLHAPHGPPMLDRSMSLWKANAVALLLIGPLAALVFGPALLLGRAESLRDGWNAILEPVVLFPGLVLTVIVHEGLHGLGFVLAGVPRASVRFGFHVPALTPYATCRVPVRTGVYRLSAALPALILGGVPWILGMALNSGVLTVVAFCMLLFAGGDLIILWLIRDLPPSTLVQDHPTKAGCSVVAAGAGLSGRQEPDPDGSVS